MNKSPGTLVVNTYNIFPWCRLDYPGLRRQCVCPLLWQIDPNYGILWQPVCHFCVGSVPIAVLVITHFLWHFLFWFAVFLIAPYWLLRKNMWMCQHSVSCIFVSLTYFYFKYPPQPVFPDPCDHTWVCKEALSTFPSALDCVQRCFPPFAIQCLQCVTLITE